MIWDSWQFDFGELDTRWAYLASEVASTGISRLRLKLTKPKVKGLAGPTLQWSDISSYLEIPS